MSLTICDLVAFTKLQSGLKQFKKDEMSLRNKIIKHFRYTKSEGIVHKILDEDGESVKVDVSLKLTRTLDKDWLQDNWDSLTNDEQACIEYKPSLNTTKFKELVEDGKANKILEAVTEKPAQASVVVIFEDES